MPLVAGAFLGQAGAVWVTVQALGTGRALSPAELAQAARALDSGGPMASPDPLLLLLLPENSNEALSSSEGALCPEPQALRSRVSCFLRGLECAYSPLPLQP